LASKSTLPVMPLCFTLRMAAVTASRVGALPPLLAASMALSRMAVES